MVTYRGRAVTEAIIATLTAAGLHVGDGDKPAGAGWAGVAGQSSFVSYVVVHPVGAFDVDGPLDEPSADVWPLHQITAYGANRRQCEELADDARAAMLDTPVVVDGRSTGPWLVDLVGMVVRTDDVQPPIYMEADRYRAYTTPA